MASITRDQVKKLNEDNKNGFRFDLHYFLFHKEKTVRKEITLGENRILAVSLMYREHFDNYADGSYCPKYTGKKVPVAHFSEGFINGEIVVSHGLGYWHNLGDAIERASYKILQKNTADMSDEKCLELFNELKRTKVNQYA